MRRGTFIERLPLVVLCCMFLTLSVQNVDIPWWTESLTEVTNALQDVSGWQKEHLENEAFSFQDVGTNMAIPVVNRAIPGVELCSQKHNIWETEVTIKTNKYSIIFLFKNLGQLSDPIWFMALSLWIAEAYTVEWFTLVLSLHIKGSRCITYSTGQLKS